MRFQKISIPPPQRVIGNSKEEGGGVLKAKIFKGKYEPKLEFPGGWGIKLKNCCGGGIWIFSGTTQCTGKNDLKKCSELSNCSSEKCNQSFDVKVGGLSHALPLNFCCFLGQENDVMLHCLSTHIY